MSIALPSTVPPNPTRRRLALPLVAALLTVAVFLLPFRLAALGPGGGFASQRALGGAVASGLVRFWSQGSRELPAELAATVDFWARFHVIKALLATALLVVLVLLAPLVLERFARAATIPRRLLALLVAGLHASVAVLALLIVVANLQGAIAPLASVLGLAPVARPGGALGSTTAEVRRTLTAGADTPALDTLLSGFTTYHVAMAWLGAAVTLALLAAAVVGRRRAAASRAERARRSLVLLTVVATVALAGFFGVVTAANISTAAHPAPALLAFFEGGS
jgi:hypothetical protein